MHILHIFRLKKYSSVTLFVWFNFLVSKNTKSLQFWFRVWYCKFKRASNHNVFQGKFKHSFIQNNLDFSYASYKFNKTFSKLFQGIHWIRKLSNFIANLLCFNYTRKFTKLTVNWKLKFNQNKPKIFRFSGHLACSWDWIWKK